MSVIRLRAALAASILALVAAAGTVGYSVGSSDPKDSEEYRHSQDVIAAKNKALANDVDALEQAADALDQIEGDLPEREAAVKAAGQKVERRQRQLDQLAKALSRRETSVLRRERVVGLAERTIARNTISGDGTYRVGTDMKAGTYRSTDNGGGCYAQISSDANGVNILTNDFTTGPALMTVSAGQFFNTSGCGDWVLQN